MLTNGSLQGVTILKDKILEDNTGVASHPDHQQKRRSSVSYTALFIITNKWGDTVTVCGGWN